MLFSRFSYINVFFLLALLPVFSQQGKMHPSLEFHGGSMYYFYKNTSTRQTEQLPSYDFGFILMNKFEMKRNSIFLKIGLNWNDKKYNNIYTGYTNPTAQKSSSLQFYYVNLPILLSFSFDSLGKWKPFISTGFVSGLLYKENIDYVKYNGTTGNGFYPSVDNEKRPKYLFFSLGATYSIFSKLSLSIEPYFRYAILSKQGGNLDNVLNNALGFRFGLVFALN